MKTLNTAEEVDNPDDHKLHEMVGLFREAVSLFDKRGFSLENLQGKEWFSREMEKQDININDDSLGIIRSKSRDFCFYKMQLLFFQPN